MSLMESVPADEGGGGEFSFPHIFLHHTGQNTVFMGKALQAGVTY